MKRTTLTRALLLTGALALAGAARAELAPMTHTETWFFPNGTHETVLVIDDTAPLQTNVLGAGSSSLPADDASEVSNSVTQTWFFPDGTQQTITWLTPASNQDFSVAVLPEPLP